MNNVTRNWQTSLLGLVGGIFGAVANGLTWKSAIAGSLLALLGAAAKDANKSGTASGA